MSAAGTILEMNNRLKHLRSERKNRSHAKLKRKYKVEAKRERIDLYKATPKEMMSIRKKIRALNLEEKRKKRLIFAISIILTIIGVYFAKDYLATGNILKGLDDVKQEIPNQEVIDFYEAYWNGDNNIGYVK